MREPLYICPRCGLVAHEHAPCWTCLLLADPIPDPLPEYPVRWSDPDAAAHRRALTEAA